MLQFAGLLEHGGRQIDAGNVVRDAGERAGQQARAACDIQNGVVGRGFGHAHDAAERVLAANRRSGGKRDGLAGELV